MQLEVGKIVEGKVTGITKFGAFVEVDTNTVGLVHISEVAATYVNDISEHLQNGQTVTVKVLSIGDDGKISLSIKKAQTPPPRGEAPARRNFDRPNHNSNHSRPNPNNGRDNRARTSNTGNDSNSNHHQKNFSSATPRGYVKPTPSGPASFEDMLSKFMKSSDEKMSEIKRTRDSGRRSGQRRAK